MSTAILTDQPAAALDVAGGSWDVRPVRRGAAPDQAVRDAFIRGAERVVVSAANLTEDELEAGLAALVGADAVVWLDPRPEPKPAALWTAARRSALPAVRVVAIGLKHHAWDALGNRARAPTVRGFAVEVALRLQRLGLDVTEVSTQASPGWAGRTGVEVARGWLFGTVVRPRARHG